MQETTLLNFLTDPKSFIRDALETGTYTKIKCGKGQNAILIDEPEWEMLTQALKLCMEHPEWTETK